MKKLLSLLFFLTLTLTFVACHQHSCTYRRVVTEPTCTEQGYTTHTCECRDSYVDNYVAANGHTYGEWGTVKEPTVDEEGLQERACSCGEKETKTIDKLESTASVGLAFTSNGDCTCYVSGIGTCTDTDIVIPNTSPDGDSVTSIGDFAFKNCTSLENVTIPDSVTSIGYSAFRRCDSLTSVTIPDSVTSIGWYAFQSCDSLTSVTIGDSVTSIGYMAFQDCTSLTSIEVDENNQYYKSMDGNLYNKDGTTLIQYAIGKQDTSFTIPSYVTTICDFAFNDCTSLTSVTFENTEGWWCFYDDSSEDVYADTDLKATGRTDISSTDLADPATAAKYLRFTYYHCYWFRTE